MSLILSVHFRDSFFEAFLPGLNNRKFSVDIPSIVSGYTEGFNLSLEVWNNVWSIIENDKVIFLNKDKALTEKTLGPGLKLECQHKQNLQNFTIMVEENYEGYSDFEKYNLDKPYITVGSADGNTITYNNLKLVSGKHAVIEGDSTGGYAITDQNSSNGTFVNGRRISGSYRLDLGDVIYIFGLKIVYLGNILAVNQPKDPVVMKGFTLNKRNIFETYQGTETKVEDEYYLRSPRQIELLDNETIEIEAPPNPNRSRRQPLLFTIGPAMTMVIPMAAGVLFSVWGAQRAGGKSSPFIFMGIITSVTSAIIGVSWALANFRYQKKMEREDEQRRVSLYRKYLDKMHCLLASKHIDNKTILDKMYPETQVCLSFGKSGNRRLWERNVNHVDFLNIRLGRGEMPSPNIISIPKERFSLIDDNLTEEPAKIKDAFERLKDVPICISMRDHMLIGVIGSSNETCYSIAQVMAAQIAAYHSYNDVKMVFLFNETSSPYFEFVKWLPHTWSEDGSLRMIANDTNGVGEVFYHLSAVMRNRMEEKDRNVQNARPLPHYIIFIADPNLVENEAIMKYLGAPAEQMGISTVLLYGEIGRLPNNCTVVIQNDSQYSGYYSLDSSFAGYKNVKFDELEESSVSSFARDLSGIKVREMQSSGAVPLMLSFLDMYKTSDVEAMDIQRRWLENRTYESMKAAIGYKGADTPLYLDIHEKYHGPHGLVAGTTGSGKSETLQTYILSLALNYHPYEVSFILIDYKGGGMAGSFEKLPHVAGVITNLGGNQTNRALASINSEIKRRQSVFNEYKIKHIDGYIELFRSGKASMPMPHLLIIADEFAELKKEQPDFVRELVSASRVGRSLGVHLILATQKPSGVVDDEIWGNSKFRICLRVQDKQDSNEMIRRPDAAYITNPGRGFFQVGNDEIFETFQSGWSGANYEPEVPYTDTKQGDARMINLWGKTCVISSKKSNSKLEKVKKTTQIEAVVAHIAKTAEMQDVKAIDNIWLPMLPTNICLQDLKEYRNKAFTEAGWLEAEWELCAVIGIVDDPVNQRQVPLSIDILNEGHILIAGSVASGKTTLLQTLLYSLVTTYSPKRVNIYIADFGSRTMGIFASAPHVGGVVLDSELDKIDKLVMMIMKELNSRKMAFSEKGIGSFKEYVRLYDDVPAIILAIDNFASFYENCPKQEENMILLSREAASYGIYIVITCTNLNDVRSKIRQNINYGIGLQMADKFEYEAVLNEKTGTVAEDKTPGRGLACYPKPLEFQTALSLSSSDPVSFSNKLKEQFDKMTAVWQGRKVPKIPQVPSDMSIGNFLQIPEVSEKLENSCYMPVGYDLAQASLEFIDLSKIYCYLISGTSRSGKTNLLKAFIQFAGCMKSKIYVFDSLARELESYSKEIAADGYMTSSEDLFDFMQSVIIPEFTRRNRGKSEFIKNGRKNLDEYIKSEQKIFIFINDMTAFCESVYSSERDMKGFMEQMTARGDQHMIYFFACISPGEPQGDMGGKRLMRNFIGWKEGLHLGGDLEHQRVLDFTVPLVERSKKLPAGMGHIVSDGFTKRVITPQV